MRSLLFAGGELADLAGRGQSLARRVGRGGGAALHFGLAVEGTPAVRPVHAHRLGHGPAVVGGAQVLVLLGYLSWREGGGLVPRRGPRNRSWQI